MADQQTVKEINACRSCGSSRLAPILSLGELYVSDFVEDHEVERAIKAPLELVLCVRENGGCGLVQLRHTVSHEVMYRNYWYLSGMNKTMTDELTGIVRKIKSLVPLAEGDVVLDIGANDGTLLRSYTKEGIQRFGFEPARNLTARNNDAAIRIENDFFSNALFANAFPGKRAKIITAIAMFYDLEDPNAFVADVAASLDPEGVFIIQMSYLPLMLITNEVGNICHEHLEYYSLLSLETLVSRHGLEVFDVETNDVNGGSFRIYIRHVGQGKTIRVSEGATERVEKMRQEEMRLGLERKETYDAFARRIKDIKEKIRACVMGHVEAGRKVYVYGASTKGNTLLQYMGLDHTLITAAAERNPMKWGKKTVGTMIPIVSEEEARKDAQHFLVLPWHFLREFMEREAEFLKAGGTFIVPMPEFREISANNE